MRWGLVAAALIPDLMLGVWDLREEQEEEEGEGVEENWRSSCSCSRFSFPSVLRAPFGGVVVGFVPSFKWWGQLPEGEQTRLLSASQLMLGHLVGKIASQANPALTAHWAWPD